MSYTTVSRCAHDAALYVRVEAAVAQEQGTRGEPTNPAPVTGPMMWAVASASDVEAAYASALANNNPNPGGDETVVTDGMILAHVQASWPPAS